MFRKIDNHKRTGAFNARTKRIVLMCDDGWEEILDYHFECASEAEAVAWFERNGWEEYDPNARLKAEGFVWDAARGVYAKP